MREGVGLHSMLFLSSTESGRRSLGMARIWGLEDWEEAGGLWRNGGVSRLHGYTEV